MGIGIRNITDLPNSFLSLKIPFPDKTTADSQTTLSERLTPLEQSFINKKFNPLNKPFPTIKSAINSNKEEIIIIDEGKVVRLLPEDNLGSRHQLFIFQTRSGQQIKVAHNISISPPVPELKIGLKIAVKGEFVKNDMVVHWTHKDPDPGPAPHEGGGIIILSKGPNYLRFIE